MLMHAINKYNRIPSFFNLLWMLLILGGLVPEIALAQNINNPNKKGPLGLQVNTMTGNLFVPRTDISVPGRMFGFNASFYYNSFLFQEELGYGKGWSFEYNIKYKRDTIPGSKLIFWGDGREDRYDSLAGGKYKSPIGFFDSLTEYQPHKYRLAYPNGVKYYFDDPTHKHITRVEEPNGNFLQFTYTDSLLQHITNNAGQTMRFTYNNLGRLATLVDEIATPAVTYSYVYDVSGNLIEARDPLNGRNRYTYLVNGPMKTLADKNNNTVDIIYFPDLRIREVVGCNKRMSFSYDTSSKSTVVTDHLDNGNQVSKYTYAKINEFYWVSTVSANCCGYNLRFEYDEYGNAIKETDANGKVYTYTFDSLGNVLTATNPAG
ncbi:MAG: hypothetical protein EOP51_33405, partial [Sphingobacteriales bacterium]